MGKKGFQGAEWWRRGQRQAYEEYEGCTGRDSLYGGCSNQPPEVYIARSRIPECSGSAKTN